MKRKVAFLHASPAAVPPLAVAEVSGTIPRRLGGNSGFKEFVAEKLLLEARDYRRLHVQMR